MSNFAQVIEQLINDNLSPSARHSLNQETCKWCGGAGCIICIHQRECEYQKQFPNGPEPIFTARFDNPQEMEQLREIFHADKLTEAFSEDGGGTDEIEAKCKKAMKERSTAPYVKGSETSKAAAEKINSFNGCSKREYELLKCMQAREGFGITETEAQDSFRWTGDYQRPAMRNLLKHDLVKKNGSKRLNKRGNPCEIWIATESGMEINCDWYLDRCE